jgi:hypothetical protein
MEDPENLDWVPPVENDNYRPRPVYDPTRRPRIIIGDAARPTSKAKRGLAGPLAPMLLMLVALIAAGIWMIFSKLMS